MTSSALRDEIDHWFFSRYFNDFIAIGIEEAAAETILAYWCVPLHMSSPTLSKWMTSSEAVIDSLKGMQSVLRQAGYTHTEAMDRNTVIYNENAGRIETIMSRRRKDGSEIDRAAISFELRRTDESWTIISTSAKPTESASLSNVW